ncbi:cytochrome P450 [Chiua virens]|nr:cytochrome P450 [Chiua virens]
MRAGRVFTIEPEYIKAILATQFSSFVKGPIFHDQFDSLLGTGVFNSDVDIWKFHRGMTRPFFAKDRISDFDIFEKHAEDAIHQMKLRMRQGYPVDIQDVASRFTLDSATEFLFGKDVRSLSAGINYPPSSSLSKDPTIKTANRTNYGSSWRIAEFWKDRVEEHMKVCFEFIDPIVADALAKKHEQKRLGVDVKEGAGEVKEGETLLEHLIKGLSGTETLNIMIAGRDTTANTLTFAVYMLSQHPDILARLRDEIMSRVGNARQPTHDDMREMKYLRAFINGTPLIAARLRLLSHRIASEDQVWPGLRGGKPIYIPAGTMYAQLIPSIAIPLTPIPSSIYAVFLMHRRKDLWGPDADLFDPDRFLDERLHKYLTPNPFIFLPFNAGPRICLGQQFAYHEVSYFLIRLLQSIDGVELDKEVQPSPPAEWAQAEGRKALEKVVLRSHLTMYAEGGVWVRMKEADAVESM